MGYEMDLRKQFLSEMFDVYKRAKQEVGYKATAFLQMITNSEDGVKIAKQLIQNNKPTDGFIKLWEAKRLDITVENLILKKEYLSLFTDEERKIAKERLTEYGYLIPNASGEIKGDQSRSIINNNIATEKIDKSAFVSNQTGIPIGISFPKLKPKERDREYKSYEYTIRDKVVFEYLFKSKSHRWLDGNIIGLNSDESKGFQAMGILHFIGLRDNHKGFFKETNLLDAIEFLKEQGDDFKIVSDSLTRVIKGIVDISEDTLIEEISDQEGKEFPEGREAYRIHRYRERNQVLVKLAKERFISIHGKLFCEACGTNFEEIYGERGKDFIEAHHTKPVSEMKEGEKTKIDDIAMLCSNCHRMVHRAPLISVGELKEILTYHFEKLRS